MIRREIVVQERRGVQAEVKSWAGPGPIPMVFVRNRLRKVGFKECIKRFGGGERVDTGNGVMRKD